MADKLPLEFAHSQSPIQKVWTSFRSGNKLGVASVVCGLLLCIPPLAIIAFLLGVSALRSRKPQTGGKPIALLGTLLGLVGCSVIVWFFHIMFAYGPSTSRFSAEFLKALQSGNPESVRAMCKPTVKQEQIEQAIEEFRKLNSTPLFQAYSASYQSNPRTHTFELEAGGTLDFGNTKRDLVLFLVRDGDYYKVADFFLQ